MAEHAAGRRLLRPRRRAQEFGDRHPAQTGAQLEQKRSARGIEGIGSFIDVSPATVVTGP